MHRYQSFWRPALAALCVALAAVGSAQAAPDNPHKPPPVRAERHAPEPGRWWDHAHGHARHYPAPGLHVRVLPPHAHVAVWAGVRYHFHDGVWYSHGPGGYLVVRPPVGIVVAELPVFRSIVTIGALTYYYANGVYYRQRAEGDYVIVEAPPIGDGGAAGGTTVTTAPAERLYVYPRQGQTAQQQASDEYECHRWAVAQTGFDPTAAATGQSTSDSARRSDYRRAQGACLEGRGYTVR